MVLRGRFPNEILQLPPENKGTQKEARELLPVPSFSRGKLAVKFRGSNVNILQGLTWGIIPLSKWFGKGVTSHKSTRSTLLKGDLLSPMVVNHLLNGSKWDDPPITLPQVYPQCLEDLKNNPPQVPATFPPTKNGQGHIFLGNFLLWTMVVND